MRFLKPSSLDEALALKAEFPQAVPLAGGTDLMVELNFDRRRPEALIDVSRIPELKRWERYGGRIRLGAGVTYTRIVSELRAELPGLAIAARTVGSPPIRNRGTVGGNLGSSSPAGDALPPLFAADAEVELASASRSRRVPISGFMVGPKRNVLEPDELIVAVELPIACGPQQFCKIGTRNAMVIAVASFALDVDPDARRVRTAIGSAGPVIIRAREAEAFLEGSLEENDGWDHPSMLDEPTAERFAALVAAAARPIDDVRGTAAYRKHALAVMARRALSWAWADQLEAA